MTANADLQRVSSSRSRLMLRSSGTAQPNDAGSVLGSVNEEGQVDTGVAINPTRSHSSMHSQPDIEKPSKSFPIVQHHNDNLHGRGHGGDGLIDIAAIPYGYGHYYEEQRRQSRGSGCLKGLAVVALCVLVGLSAAFIALSLSTGQTVKQTMQMYSLTTDTDGDGLSDDLEKSLGLDPYNWDTNGDGKGDGADVAIILGSQAMMMPSGAKSPKAPSAPKSPKAPSAPKSPKAPSAPKSPKAPSAPKSPKAPSAPKSPKAPSAPKSPKAPSAPKSPKTAPLTSGLTAGLTAPLSTVAATAATSEEEASAPATTVAAVETTAATSEEEAPAPATTVAAVETTAATSEEEAPAPATTEAAAVDTDSSI